MKLAESKAKGEEASCDVPQARWTTFAKGSRWKGPKRVLTGGIDCEALVRQ